MCFPVLPAVICMFCSQLFTEQRSPSLLDFSFLLWKPGPKKLRDSSLFFLGFPRTSAATSIPDISPSVTGFDRRTCSEDTVSPTTCCSSSQSDALFTRRRRYARRVRWFPPFVSSWAASVCVFVSSMNTHFPLCIFLLCNSEHCASDATLKNHRS